MSKTRIHTKQQEGRTIFYSYFDSVGDFNAFVDIQVVGFNAHNRDVLKQVNSTTKSKLESGTTWYGSPNPKDVSELNSHTYFLGMELLKQLQSKIKNKLEAYLKLREDHILPKPKIAYNDRGLGVFSFDRVAMGLYRLQPSGSNDKVENTVHQLQIELDQGNKTTAVKSVYAYFKNKATSYPSLKIYLLSGANANVEGNDMLYVGLACAELVGFMESRGVAVEVNMLLGTSFSNKLAMGVIRVKRFQDTLDKNQLLLMSSDPRYFRYRGFKSLISLADHFGLNIPYGLGSITSNMAKDFVTRLQDTNSTCVVFEQSYAMDTAVKEVTTIIENYTKQMKSK